MRFRVTRTQRKTPINSSYTKVDSAMLGYNNLNENNQFYIIDIRNWADHDERCENHYAMNADTRSEVGLGVGGCCPCY